MSQRPVDRHTRIAGLDILRGLAIALVLLRHAFPDLFGGAGIVGVAVFFALSGYLITGILLRDIERRGSIDYRRFYRNRLVRLVPALLFALSGFVLVTVFWDPIGERQTIPRTLAVAITYTADLPGFSKGSVAMSHLWTLAIEEQFYVVWPAVLLIGVRLRRINLLLVALAAGLSALCVTTLLLAPTVESIYSLPTSWAGVMVVGAAARINHVQISNRLPRTNAGRNALSFTSLAALMAISATPDIKDWFGTYVLLAPIIGLCTVVLIFHLRSWQDAPSAAFWKLAMALGTISYATYLWNYPVATWINAQWSGGAIANAASIPTTIALAAISWILIERPISNWKSRTAQTPPQSPSIIRHPGAPHTLGTKKAYHNRPESDVP